MSTGSAAAAPAAPVRRDVSWLWTACFIVFVALVGVVLGVLAQDMYHYSWTSLLFLIVSSLMLWAGLTNVLTARSESDEMGVGHMCFGILLTLFGAFLLALTLVPPSVIASVQSTTFYYKHKANPKPHLSEIVAPATPPEMAWVNVELPTPPAALAGTAPATPSSYPVFVQIQMTEQEAKEGFPVLKSALNARGKIVGWYGEGATESRTDDL